ncbi:hypothetical protein AB1A81_03395 [Bdellovibrio bacteriovorus]|uniref:Uncharacterized protein n=1 Tax=Bdellovibrio bacteriovorus (strain ATCC 15356 / DSM 50701 / NCIMB 9529 / HD100) TaxID=264462 RepID=Q6MPV2_BDEBA|nr:hypothetical protein [Bdellovibrio bacteriovorus]BEV67244.1 hypothetical protein Bb109J_c0664 [Bdellovibrio bacteriovorus]CAE78695.1 hypothetical protein predicted by Glimmer/Critica [Bdellovibrio bacteriovorus HD100]
MELPQKFMNLLVIIIPLGLFILAFLVLDYRQKRRLSEKNDLKMKHPGPRS